MTNLAWLAWPVVGWIFLALDFKYNWIEQGRDIRCSSFKLGAILFGFCGPLSCILFWLNRPEKPKPDPVLFAGKRK